MYFRQQPGESEVYLGRKAVRIFLSVILTLMLWVYAVFMAFILYGARFTPDGAVLVRLAASILSDLVWIPPGIFVWYRAFAWFLTRVIRTEKILWRIICRVLTVFAVIIFFICCYETAFAFLFIPLSGFVVCMVVRLYCDRARKKIISYYLPVTLLIILTVLFYRWQMLPNIFFPRNGENCIKVMGYNIFAHADYDDRMRTINAIKRESPDVICLMEFNPMRDPELFKQELGDHYPYMLIGESLTRWTRSAAFILSRYPLENIEVERISEKEDRHVNFIFAEMDVHGRKVNIVNYHLITVGHRIFEAAQKSLNSKELVEEAAGAEAAIEREKFEQVHYLLEKISTFREPTILCGDLNDTPNSRSYYLLKRQFINTFSAKGWGLGSTFGESWMKNRFKKIFFMPWLARDIMRIDHIFTSLDMDVVSSKVIKNAKGSDHKPVVTVIRLPEK